MGQTAVGGELSPALSNLSLINNIWHFNFLLSLDWNRAIALREQHSQFHICPSSQQQVGIVKSVRSP